jgi:hypothetical protein
MTSSFGMQLFSGWQGERKTSAAARPVGSGQVASVFSCDASGDR